MSNPNLVARLNALGKLGGKAKLFHPHLATPGASTGMLRSSGRSQTCAAQPTRVRSTTRRR
jgi:hypothetical protein